MATPAIPDEVRACVARCLRARTDIGAHLAWQTLTEALTGVDGEAVGEVLDELALDAEQPILLEYLAAEIARRGDHERVILLLERARKERPQRRSLLLGLQTAHLHLGHDDEAATVAEMIASAPVVLPTNEATSIQNKIDSMHRLVNAAYALFVSQKSVAELSDTLERACDLEQELLEYWRDGDELAAGRGELTASGMYIAAMRQAGDSYAAAAWFRHITADRSLLAQCLRDFRTSGENTLNNGIGALIDTHRQSDRNYGGEILDFLDDHAPFETAMLPLACCCMATQRGELERALDYLEEAVRLGKGKELLSDGGSDICQMAWDDEDLGPLHRLPEFTKIVGARKS